jgi:hypothetical protein
MKSFFVAFLFLISWTPTLLAQWSGELGNPLLIDNSQYHLDPEIQCTNGRYLFYWASASAVRRKLVAYDPDTRSIWFEPQAEKVGFIIRNMLGQTVAWGAVGGCVQVPRLAPGIYVLIIQTHRTVVETRKILVQ